jgi:membrane protease YdiL (CAAX protease family)
VLFGLAHAHGGPALVVLATFAGIGYGAAYQRSGRIEAAILAHFALNAAHFLMFTYPALR